ncbi:phosphodiester glycosidase family protein [Candidatus Gottesmanbacteria bacterium]|nr:phosphodiester glycosidase family protein [Candidatus Gottesmanbacteria bacterium]
MRLLLVSVTTIVFVMLLFIFRKPQTTHQIPLPSNPPTVTPSPQPPLQSIDVEQNGETYRIAWLRADTSQISLIPNFTQKRTARSLVDGNRCDAVINGGFYTKEGKPTGFFIADGKTIRQSIPNTLLNGYFLVDTQNRAAASFSAPDQTPRIGLQTGPILIRDGNALRLTIRDDELARRVIVGITQNGAVIFLAIYDPDNPWSGPRLADTPTIVSKVQVRLQLTDALNLDGGSASAFIRDDLSLEEFTSVGSFFCIT